MLYCDHPHCVCKSFEPQRWHSKKCKHCSHPQTSHRIHSKHRNRNANFLTFSSNNSYVSGLPSVSNEIHSTKRSRKKNTTPTIISKIKHSIGRFFNIPWWIPLLEMEEYVKFLSPFTSNLITTHLENVIMYCLVLPINKGLPIAISREEHINLFDKGISDIEADHIAYKLSVLSTVRSIDLRKNQIGEHGVKSFAKMLQANTSITAIDMRENPNIGTIGGNMFFNVLQEKRIQRFGDIMISDINGLDYKRTIVDLSDKKLGNLEAIILANFLKTNSVVTSLDTRNNPGIGRSGGIFLSKVVKKSKRIMSFSGIRIVDINGSDINKKFVSLDSKSLGDTETIFVAKCIKINQVLKKLHMENNNIGNTGIKEIAEVLKINGTLTNLSLLFNKFTDEGAQAISNSLVENRTLVTLWIIYGNNIGEEKKKNLQTQMTKHHSIKYFM